MAEDRRRGRGRISRLDLVIAVTVVAGTALFVGQLARPEAFQIARAHPGELALFFVLVVACEARPIMVTRTGEVAEIVASTTFVFAIFLSFGPAPAMLAQAAASLLADLTGGKGARRAVYNVGQYWVSWGVAASTYQAIAGIHRFSEASSLGPRDVAAIAAAAVIYFLMNSSLVGVVVAVHNEVPILPSMVSTAVSEATSDWVLLALAPIVSAVGARSVALLPLLLLPVLAVYRSASVSLEKEHQALHDTLTDLPNRLLFGERLNVLLADARRHGRKAAVLLIDLDRFKEVNDTLGHQAGDALLQQVGPRIAAAMRRGTVIARFGGDEFAVVLDDLSDASEAIAAAHRIVAALEEPFVIDDFGLDVSASVGVAMYPEHGDHNDVLVQRADIAMYVAKANQSGVALYDPAEDNHSLQRLALLGELRTALSSDSIVLHYQPKLELASNDVRCVEALVRWEHPDHGLIMPDRFVPLAEHTGLIGLLTSHVLEAAVRQARRWLDAGIEMRIAVNLSPRNLHDVGLPGAVGKLLGQYGLPAHLLELEITESSIMTEPGRARRVLQALDAMGIALAIDDFGTGYSSLAYLQQLPVNEIKIDQSFVSGMLSNGGDDVIVRSTIELAHNLGLLVTAEGVESEAALMLLHDAGCDSVQGYLISRPVPAADLEVWLRKRSQEPEPALAGFLPTMSPRFSVAG